MVNSPLIRPYFSGAGGGIGGVPLVPMIVLLWEGMREFTFFSG